MLSELEKLIIAGLKICRLEPPDIVIIMLQLKTEKQQWEMAEYLNNVVGAPPSREEILKTAARIATTKNTTDAVNL